MAVSRTPGAAEGASWSEGFDHPVEVARLLSALEREDPRLLRVEPVGHASDGERAARPDDRQPEDLDVVAAGIVESRMRGNSHVRFGGRAEETDLPKGKHRASARSDHTHATLLLKEGIPAKVVSERLGHSTPGFTMATYQHVIPGMQADAAAAFGHLVFGDSTDQEEGPNA